MKNLTPLPKCNLYQFWKCQHRFSWNPLFNVPKFVVPYRYLLGTDLLWAAKNSLKKTKTPLPKYSKMVLSDIFDLCKGVQEKIRKNCFYSGFSVSLVFQKVIKNLYLPIWELAIFIIRGCPNLAFYTNSKKIKFSSEFLSSGISGLIILG